VNLEVAPQPGYFVLCQRDSKKNLKERKSAPTLYKRVGGYDAIAAVTDDFIGRVADDKQLERFFGGVSADSQNKLRHHVVDQLCEAAGGPCIYTGQYEDFAYGAWDFRK
jgi:truncated hemoglobin YjbI